MLINLLFLTKGLGVHSGGNGVITSYGVGSRQHSVRSRETAICISSAQTNISLTASNSQGEGLSVLTVPSNEHIQRK